MTDKTEVVTIRMSPEMREALDEWMEREGYASEADAVRGLIRRHTMGEQMLQEFEADDEIMEKLQALEADIERLNRPLWERIFRPSDS